MKPVAPVMKIRMGGEPYRAKSRRRKLNAKQHGPFDEGEERGAALTLELREIVR
jgi:hypothetical protein